jgi:hypothetical protein
MRAPPGRRRASRVIAQISRRVGITPSSCKVADKTALILGCGAVLAEEPPASQAECRFRGRTAILSFNHLALSLPRPTIRQASIVPSVTTTASPVTETERSRPAPTTAARRIKLGRPIS